MSSAARNALVAGAILVIVGYFVITGFNGGGGDSTTGCALESAGVTAIATGLTKADSTARIIAEAGGGIAATAACNSAIDKLRSGSPASVTLGAAGSQTNVTIDRSSILGSNRTSLSRTIGCILKYPNQPVQQTLCEDTGA